MYIHTFNTYISHARLAMSRQKYFMGIEAIWKVN